MDNFNKQKGYSLIELLIALILVVSLSVFAFQKLYLDKREVGGAERILAQVSSRIVERREDAIRLNAETSGNLTTQINAKPLPIDFSDLSKTASLTIEGDENGDCLDDFDEKPVTCLQSSGEWQIAYRDDSLTFPSVWKVAGNFKQLGNIPLIAEGVQGKGILVQKVGFDQNGRALAWIDGQWSVSPNSSPSPSLSEAPFWAIYFIAENQKQAVAIAIYPSGFTEKFRFDGKKWVGFANREL